MAAIFAVQTTIEIAVALLLIWGFINEKKFIAFEDKLARAIAINIRNRRRRKLMEQRSAMPPVQQRMPAESFSFPEEQPVEHKKQLPKKLPWAS